MANKMEAMRAKAAAVQQAKKSAMADKMKASAEAANARRSADAGKAQAMKAQAQSQKASAAKAQQAKQSAFADRMKAAPKASGPSDAYKSLMGKVAEMKANPAPATGRLSAEALAQLKAKKPAMPARPMGGGMGSMAGRGGTPTRPMVRPMGGMGMGMKKGGRAKK